MNTRQRIATYLQEQPVGHTFTKAEVRAAIGGSMEEQFGRRMRELREHGWVISTYREDSSLAVSQHKLVTKGDTPR